MRTLKVIRTIFFICIFHLTFCIGFGQIPDCPILTSPTNGERNVSLSTTITWSRVDDAITFILTIGTMPDSGDILNEFAVENVNRYTINNLPAQKTIYIKIIPANGLGNNNTTCTEMRFTTGDGIPVLNCTRLISPPNEATNVSPTTDLRWNSVSAADGYILSVGTSPDGIDVIDNLDVENVTSYSFNVPIQEGTRFYVKITPYIGFDMADNCIEDSFTTRNPIVTVEIPKFFTPNNDGYHDVWEINQDKVTGIQNIFIFDRYGRLLKQLMPSQSWDGNYLSKRMISDTYWYRIELVDGSKMNGYFMLKR